MEANFPSKKLARPHVCMVLALPWRTGAFCSYGDGDDDLYRWQRDESGEIKGPAGRRLWRLSEKCQFVPDAGRKPISSA